MATPFATRGTLRLAIAVGALVMGCAGTTAPTGGSPGAGGASVPDVASPEPSPPATSSPTPDASIAVTVDLGAVGITPRGSRVTVHSFGPSSRSLEPPAGSDWVEADLEWCLPSTIVNDVSLGNIRYELVLELGDGSTIEPEATADASDEVYASDGTFSADECVRGALVFAVPSGSTPAHLLLIGSFGGMRWRLA